MSEIRLAIVGCGGITLQNHLPGIAMCGGARLTALCDANAQTPSVLRLKRVSEDRRARKWWCERMWMPSSSPHRTFPWPDCQAAIAAGKHVLCEKPIAMDRAKAMAEAADQWPPTHDSLYARFVPAMRYLSHLVQDGFLGDPYHFRCRLQDWGNRDLGGDKKSDWLEPESWETCSPIALIFPLAVGAYDASVRPSQAVCSGSRGTCL